MVFDPYLNNALFAYLVINIAPLVIFRQVIVKKRRSYL